MLTKIIHAPEKAASSEFGAEEDALPSIAFDLIASSVAQFQGSAVDVPEGSEQQGASHLITVDVPQLTEEGAPQYVKAPDYDPSQPEYHTGLKQVELSPLVVIHFDASSANKYPWVGPALEPPSKSVVVRPIGRRLRQRSMIGTADLLSALSEAQKAARPVPKPADRARFRALADKWAQETEGISVHSRAIMHKAYQQIIGMGPVAIPLLLEELRDRPNHWMWALSVLTDADPARGARTFPQARAAWLNWGREKGYLDG